jgi:fatty-acyl-CoA synthase
VRWREAISKRSVVRHEIAASPLLAPRDDNSAVIARNTVTKQSRSVRKLTVPLNVDGWSFGRFIDEIGERFAAVPALVASDYTFSTTALRRWSYAGMLRDVHALQWSLMEAGVRAGERVGVMLSSFPEWVLYLFAVTRLGAIFLPINTRFRARELHHVLSHSGASTLITMGRYLGHDYAATIAEIRDRLPALRTIVGVRGKPHPEALDSNRLLADGRALLASRGIPPRADDPEETALLFYTSGTTSFPKGVPLTHSNVLPHSVRAGLLLDLKPGEKVLNFYPFFGISGGANKVLSTFGSGATLVFQDAFRAEEAWDMMEAEQCSVIHGVDVHVRELIAVHKRRGVGPQPDRRGTIAFTGGIDEPLARAMGEALGLRRFSHPYGMTETNPMILRNELDDPFEAAARPGGRIAPNVEVRVVDPESGADRGIGVEGEIVVRGPTVMKGYYNDPEATAAAFRGGWFHSGDLGVRTEDGLIFYVGRLKDMLKVGGFNVAPQEIEGFLSTHRDIEDVAVTSASDARLGEVAVAFVQLKRGAHVSAEALIAACRDNLANFKVPRAIYFVDALPYHTAAHGAKLQRHVLREWARERACPSPPTPLPAGARGEDRHSGERRNPS